MSDESIETFKLNIVLDALAKEKSIDKDILIDALKQAMLTAARRKLGLTADLEARFDTTATMEEVLQRHAQRFKVHRGLLQVHARASTTIAGDVPKSVAGLSRR